MDKYIVSIIIPCFNASTYIDTCMTSVINNYFNGVQVIIVNNGSTDDTLEKCKKYQNLNYVKIINQNNEGHCGSKNTGMDHATGKYIMFVDVDDELMPNSVKKAVEIMESENSDITTFGYIQTTELNGEIIEKKTYIPEKQLDCCSQQDIFNNVFYSIFGISVDSIVEWNEGKKLNRHKKFSSLWSHIYKREIVERSNLRLNRDLFMYEDGMFNAYYLLDCKRSTIIQEPLYLYKKRDTGITITKYDRAKVDLKLPLLLERNKLRDRVFKSKGIDILPWYAGSNVLTLIQMCRNYSLDKTSNDGYKEWIRYAEIKEVKDSIKLYPLGGSLKKRIPIIMLKKGRYRLLFLTIRILHNIGVNINV